MVWERTGPKGPNRDGLKAWMSPSILSGSKQSCIWEGREEERKIPSLSTKEQQRRKKQPGPGNCWLIAGFCLYINEKIRIISQRFRLIHIEEQWGAVINIQTNLLEKVIVKITLCYSVQISLEERLDTEYNTAPIMFTQKYILLISTCFTSK